MLNNFADTDLSRLEMAQQFVRSNLTDLPDNEITALHVFGSGTEIDGCADTTTLVPPSIVGTASTDIQSALSAVQPVSRDAALILGAVRALEALADAEVNGTSFQGNVTLIIVTGGSGTCLDNSELIQLTANRAGFNLELVQINIDADQDEDSGFALVDNARTINIQNPEDLESAGEELENDGSTGIASGTEQAPPVLNPPTQENTATSFPTVTPTGTSTPIPPTAVPTSTPAPTQPPTITPVPGHRDDLYIWNRNSAGPWQSNFHTNAAATHRNIHPAADLYPDHGEYLSAGRLNSDPNPEPDQYPDPNLRLRLRLPSD